MFGPHVTFSTSNEIQMPLNLGDVVTLRHQPITIQFKPKKTNNNGITTFNNNITHTHTLTQTHAH